MAEEKTFAGLLETLLADWRKFLRFLLLSGVLACILVGLVWAVLKIARPFLNTAQELDLGNLKIVSASHSAAGDEYVAIVDPHGWQDSGVFLKATDQIEFDAYGKVNIDFGDVVEKVERRKEFEKGVEDYLRKKNKSLDPKSPDSKDDPGYYFTNQQWKELTLRRPWIGPEGDRKSRESYEARAKYKILKEASAGCLIGAVVNSTVNNSIRDVSDSECAGGPCLLMKQQQRQLELGKRAFVIGKQLTGYTAQENGELWLNISDQWNVYGIENEGNVPPHVIYPNIYFDDNVGYFLLHIRVRRA